MRPPRPTQRPHHFRHGTRGTSHPHFHTRAYPHTLQYATHYPPTHLHTTPTSFHQPTHPPPPTPETHHFPPVCGRATPIQQREYQSPQTGGSPQTASTTTLVFSCPCSSSLPPNLHRTLTPRTTSSAVRKGLLEMDQEVQILHTTARPARQSFSVHDLHGAYCPLHSTARGKIRSIYTNLSYTNTTSSHVAGPSPFANSLPQSNNFRGRSSFFTRRINHYTRNTICRRLGIRKVFFENILIMRTRCRHVTQRVTTSDSNYNFAIRNRNRLDTITIGTRVRTRSRLLEDRVHA